MAINYDSIVLLPILRTQQKTPDKKVQVVPDAESDPCLKNMVGILSSLLLTRVIEQKACRISSLASRLGQLQVLHPLAQQTPSS